MQAAGIGHDPLPGLQVQVVGVGEHHLGARIGQLAGGHALHGGQGAHRHEPRRGDRAMGRVKATAAGPCAAAAGGDVE